MRINRQSAKALGAYVAIVGLGLLAYCAQGCDHGSNIPIDECDTCAQTDVLECCPECSDCFDEYSQGYSDGKEAIECEPPRVIYLCEQKEWRCKKSLANLSYYHHHDWQCGHCSWVTTWKECDVNR